MRTFEKIITAYWHTDKFDDLKYEHNQMFDYSINLRGKIINDLLDKNYSVMLKPNKNNLIIWIDDGRFGQR